MKTAGFFLLPRCDRSPIVFLHGVASAPPAEHPARGREKRRLRHACAKVPGTNPVFNF